jgi:muconolactone delta-isomerase
MFLKKLLRTPITLGGFLLLFLSAAPLILAQGGETSSASLSQAEVDRLVNAFTAKERHFRQALNEYAFKRDALLQSIGMGGQVTGEYHRVSIFTFDDNGNRFEKINFFPMPSFGGVTQEDLEDLGGISPFALEPDKIDKYNFRYVGKEKIDELSLYVFDVSPKAIPDPKKLKERLFSGRVWVDDQELQIVKTKGKGLPETKKNKFPTVETYREQIDGRFWFPTYSYADEELIFENGEVLHLRMKVRYSDFELARAKVKIIEVDGPDTPKKEAKPSTTPPTKP